MGFPDESPENILGYEGSNVANEAVHFRKTEDTLRKLFLIHGTGDDNVHLQHTMVLAKQLIDHGVMFKQQVNNKQFLENKIDTTTIDKTNKS